MWTKNLKAKLVFFVLILSLFCIFSYDLYSQENKIRIIKKDAFLRLNPDEESEILKALPMGSEFIVEEILEEWVKIMLPVDENGIIILGYVHKSFLRLSTSGALKTTVQPKIPIENPILIPFEKPKPFPSQEINEDYITWKKKLELAKTKRSTGTLVSIIGSVISIVTTVAEQSDSNSNYDYDRTPYIVAYGVSLVSTIAGLAISLPASKEVKQLELEGARKGYILASINTIPKGFSLSLAFSF